MRKSTLFFAIAAGSILFLMTSCKEAANQKPTEATESPAAAVKPSITIEEVNAAQQAWCDALVRIGKIHKEGGDAKAEALKVLSEAYDYDNGTVFFKPTLASGKNTFRLTKEGALAYFVGGDTNFPEDKGFAFKPWIKVTYDNVDNENHGVQIYGDIAITMGNVFLTAEDGTEVMVDKTFVFKRGDDGKLRLVVHKSALPFTPAK